MKKTIHKTRDKNHARRLTAMLMLHRGDCVSEVAGVLMQVMTLNPLASPGLFGVNSGVIFFIVLSSVWIGAASLTTLVWSGFLGAAVAGGLVFGIGSLGRGSTSPVRILLAGGGDHGTFPLVYPSDVGDQSGWIGQRTVLAGSVAGRESDLLTPLLPYVVMGLVFSRVQGTGTAY